VAAPRRRAELVPSTTGFVNHGGDIHPVGRGRWRTAPHHLLIPRPHHRARLGAGHRPYGPVNPQPLRGFAWSYRRAPHPERAPSARRSGWHRADRARRSHARSRRGPRPSRLRHAATRRRAGSRGAGGVAAGVSLQRLSEQRDDLAATLIAPALGVGLPCRAVARRPCDVSTLDGTACTRAGRCHRSPGIFMLRPAWSVRGVVELMVLAAYAS
jgi:hypothetical protein